MTSREQGGTVAAVHQLRDGVWHWKALHPDWTPKERWPQLVSSYAIDSGEHLTLFDPLAVPDHLLRLRRRRSIVLTAPWHERDTQKLVDAFGATVYAPPPDTARDLMRKYGATAEQAGDGSPDLKWLCAEPGNAHWYHDGERFDDTGIEAHAGREENDMILWIESLRTLVVGDTIVDFGTGFALNPWLRGGVSREEVVDALRPLLALPIDLVLPAHGEPTDRSGLEGALAAPR